MQAMWTLLNMEMTLAQTPPWRNLQSGEERVGQNRFTCGRGQAGERFFPNRSLQEDSVEMVLGVRELS